MVNIFDLISQKIELFRLEQRYTKRRNRRSTFISDATYVDGEYIYPYTSSTTSPSSSSSSSSPPPTLSKRHSMLQFGSGSQESMSAEESRSPTGVRFGGVAASEGVADLDKAKSSKRGWNSARRSNRRSMVPVQEVRWEERS